MSKMFTDFEKREANADYAGVEDIDPRDLWRHRENVTIVDVRQPDEFTGELGHIPGAKLVVLSTLPEHLADFGDDETLVFVCRSGARSGRAAAFALEQGLTQAFNMKGGMLLWNELGLETVRGVGE